MSGPSASTPGPSSAPLARLGSLGEGGESEGRPLYQRFVALLDDERCAEAAIVGLGALGDPRAIELFAARLESASSPDQVRVLVAALGGIDDARAVPLVLAAKARLDSDDFVIWIGALIDLYAALGTEVMLPLVGVDLLLDLLTYAPSHFETPPRDHSSEMRCDLVRTLFPPSDVETLLEHLASESDSRLRSHISHALGVLCDTQAVDPLILRMQTDVDPTVRQEAAEALGAIGDPRAAEPLLECLDKADESAKSALVKALERILGAEGAIELVPFLGNPETAYYLAWALGRLKAPDTIDPLVRLLQSPGHPSRSHVANALSFMRDVPGIERAIEPMEALLRGETDPEVRQELWRSYRSLLPLRGVDFLLERLASETDPDVQSAVVWALTRGDEPRVLEAFLARLNADDLPPALRHHLIHALGSLNDPRASETLGVFLEREDDPRERFSLAQALCLTDAPGAVDIMTAQVHRDPDQTTRERMAYCLRMPLETLPSADLTARLQSETHTDVRWAIAYTLGKVGGISALKPLLERLEQEEEPRTRWALAEAAGRIGRRQRNIPQPPSPSEERATGAEGVGARGPAQRGNATGGGHDRR